MSSNDLSAQASSFESDYEAKREQILSGLKEFLRFESVSADPEYDQGCIDCADWLSEKLTHLGFGVELLSDFDGKPIILAKREGRPGAKRVLFYGHYDVQPADPVELWESAPFEPEVRDGRLYARGAQDNKGQLWYVIAAIEHLLEKDALDASLTLLIEGEEETGSSAIARAIDARSEDFGADVLLVCDTGTRSPDVASITMGLRGIVTLSVELSGPRNDLHSGVHGGVAPNPVQHLVALLGKLHDSNGRIAIPGFYDSIDDTAILGEQLADAWVPSDEEYRALTGVYPKGGEQGLSFTERRGLRPALEFNGIYGGYSGAGSKTIIPTKAGAKISARIVAGQDPKQVLEQTKAFLQQHAPDSLSLEFPESEEGGPALLAQADGPATSLASEVLRHVGVERVEFMWEGASIPILSSLQERSGASPLLVGFGLEEDRIHAPNESFSLEQFKKGFVFSSLFLANVSLLS